MFFVESCLMPLFYPNPDEVWSESNFRGLLYHGINLRIMRTKLKKVVTVALVDEVSFDEASGTG